MKEKRMWVPGCLMPVVGECGRRFTLRDVTAKYTGHALRKEAGKKIGSLAYQLQKIVAI
jgi:hypothetical protein